MPEILAALIDEENCIGCSKCLRVCPTDAIVGAKHMLHSVMVKYCTSCEECINICPTNCISLMTPNVAMSAAEEHRLTQKKQQRLSAVNQQKQSPVSTPIITIDKQPSRQQLVADAIARVKARKNLI